MVRSIWKTTLVTSLVWAGLAWAQQPLPSAGSAAKLAESTHQVFTVQEVGKAGQKCKVLRTWKTPEGKTAYQVQALDTGEMMTIVETGRPTTLPAAQPDTGPRVHAIATRIFHWGWDRKPPAGAPIPPVEYVQAAPAITPRPGPVMATAPARSSPAMTEARVLPQLPTSISQNNSSGSTSISQPKTTLPSDRFGSTSIAQPKTTVQDTSMTQPRTTALDKPNSTPAPRKPAAIASGLANSGMTTIPAPKRDAVHERVVQVVPPKSDSMGAAATTAATSVSAPEPKSSLLNRQAVPVAPPSGMTTGLPVPEKKPAEQRILSSGQATRSVPALTAHASTPSQPAAVPQNRQAVPVAPLSGVTTGLPATEKKPAEQSIPGSGQATKPVPALTAHPSTPAPPAALLATLGKAAPEPGVQAAAPAENRPYSYSSFTISPYFPMEAGYPDAWIHKSPAPSVPTRYKTPAPPPARDQGATTRSETKRAGSTKPATTPAAAGAPTNVNKAASVTPAPPSDWRKSWGKADDGKAKAAEKPAQKPPASNPPAAKLALPQADTKRPDPLQTPQQYNPPPADEKPSAQKREPMLIPALNTASTAMLKPATARATQTAQTIPKAEPMPIPALSSASTTTLKPVAAVATQTSKTSAKAEPTAIPAPSSASTTTLQPAAAWATQTVMTGGKSDRLLIPAPDTASTTISKPAAVMATETTVTSRPASSPPVPLGAQSVIQAGDVGAAAVRYLPVPMATIPEVRRAPVPPMTNAAQAYGMPGAAPARNPSNLANAFTPAPSGPAMVRATNAFGSTVPTDPGSPVPQPVAPTPAGTMAQGLSPNPAGQAVVMAGFQGSVSPYATVPVTYQSITNQTQPIFNLLTAPNPSAENARQMLTVLRDSLYPSQREWAAESMVTLDWRTHPQVVQALTTAAREDPAATVRAGCVRCLAKMNVNTVPVIITVQGLKADADPRVRQEADRALSILAPGQK